MKELEGGKSITNVERQIRWPIYCIRKRIKNLFESVETNDFIEIRRNRGIEDKEFGYRLNPFKISA